MLPLASRIRHDIRRHDLLPAGCRVAVAVSGGPDSVALLHILLELASDGAFTVAGVAHLNHRLRGEASDRDEQFCRELASRLALPCAVEAEDVAGRARRDRSSIEDAARRARYSFLERAAGRLEATRVAVGHTRDDQAETVLLRLIRGAGPDGLAGIRPRAGAVVRPLLDVTRDEILAYLGARQIPFCDDASNRDLEVPRNRVRHELVPLLRARFSPGIVEALARAAAIARLDAELLQQASAAAAEGVLTETAEGVALDRPGLDRLAPALRSRVALAALKRVSGGRFVGSEHVEALLRVASEDGPERCGLPGAAAERRGPEVVLIARGRAPRPAGRIEFRYSLSIPGEVEIPEAGYLIEARRVEMDDAAGPLGSLAGRGPTAVIDARALPAALSVRGRRPGDAFRPLGLSGRKKLQDFFVDRKVPRAGRGLVPLVVDDDDRIVWVAGHALADEFRVTDRTKAVVILTLKGLGGQA